MKTKKTSAFFLLNSFAVMTLLLIPQQIFSQDFSQSNSSDSVTMCLVVTKEGTRLQGKLVSENADRITVLDLILGEVNLSKKNIRYFEKMQSESIFKIEFQNNSSITGKMVSADKNKWKVDSKILGVVDVNVSDIKDFYLIHSSGEQTQSEQGNIDPGRYFAGPSPFALKKRKLVYQNTYVLVNGLSYGLFNDLTVTGGLLYIYIPYGNIKYAKEITHNVHISLGVMGGGFPIIGFGSVPMVGAGYAQLGCGNYQNHISAGAYYPYFGSFSGGRRNNNGFADNASFSLTGIKQIGEHFSIMAETYLIPYTTRINNNYYYYSATYITSYVYAGAAGLKIFLKKGLFNSNAAVLNIGFLWAAGEGLISRNNSFFAIPMISYSHISSRSK